MQVMVVCCNIVSPLPFFWVLYVFMNKLKFIVSFIKRRWCTKKKFDNKYDASIAFYFFDFKTCSCNLKFVVHSLQLQKEVSNSKFEVVHVFNLTKSRYMFHVHCILYTQNLKMDYNGQCLFIYLPPYYSSK